MKYFILFICLSVYPVFAQVNTDSLFSSLILQLKYDTLQYGNENDTAVVSEKSLQELYLQFNLPDENLPVPFNNTFTIPDLNKTYDFSNTQPGTQAVPLTFSTYYLNKLQQLEKQRTITIQQRDEMLKAMRDAQYVDSPEIAYLRKVLELTKTAAVLALMIMSLVGK